MIDAPPMKYSYKTRIGNWSEEWELDETKLKDFKYSQETGDMMVLNTEKKKDLTVRKAALSYLPNSELLDGAKVMLQNTLVGGNIACNIWDKINVVEDSYGVSCSLNTQPLTRSVFKIVKIADIRRGNCDKVIRYGDKVRIQANQRLFGRKKNMYLMSQFTNTQSYARVSHYQEVTITSRMNNLTVWTIEHFNNNIRFEMEGEPVKANEKVLIKHCHTGKWLGTDQIPYKTLYGAELEVFTHSFTNTSKSQNLAAELDGRITVDTPMRGQQEQNSFQIISAASPNDDFDEENSDQPIRIQDVMDSLRKALLMKGAYGLSGLREMFQRVDYDNLGALDEYNVKWAFRNYGMQLLDQEVRLIVKEFANQTGLMDYNRFVTSVNSITGGERINRILQVYQFLSQNLNGAVTIENLGKIYDASKHPDVIEGLRTEREVFDEFIKNWGKIDPFTIISENQFLSYFCDLSGCILSEARFEKTLKYPFNIDI